MKTIELGEAIEGGYNPSLYGYPICDENLREPLNNLIIEHYYFREIGFETIGRFDFYLRRKMSEIMPRYNYLFSKYPEGVVLGAALEELKYSEAYRRETTVDTATRSTDRMEGSSIVAGSDNRKDNTVTSSNSATDNDSEMRTIQYDAPQAPLAGDKTHLQTMQDQGAKSSTDSASDTTGISSSEGDSEQNTESQASSQGDSDTSSDGSSEGSRNYNIFRTMSKNNTASEMVDSTANLLYCIVDELSGLFLSVWQPYSGMR